MKNRLRHYLFIVVLMLFVGFLLMSFKFYAGRPQPTRDFRAESNARLREIPEHEKAWPIYRDLWIKFDFGQGGAGTFDELYTPDVAGQKRRLVRADDGESWRLAVEKLSSCAELLEGFRVAAQRPSFGLPVATSVKDVDPRDVRALFPKSHLSMLAEAKALAIEGRDATLAQTSSSCVLIARKMPTLLVVDSRWAMEQGDSERITRNVEAIFGMARQINDHERLLDGMLALAFSSLGIDLIDECVDANVDFDDRQLERMAVAVQRTRIDEIFRFSSERLFVDDSIQHSYTDDGRGDGRITWRGLELMDEAYDPRQFAWSEESALMDQLGLIPLYVSAPSAMLRYPTRKQLTEKANSLFDQVDDYMYAPLTDDKVAAFESQVAELPTSYKPIQRFMQQAVKYKSRVLQSTGDRAGSLLGLAVLRFKQQNGTLPTTLEEMVGTFLEEIPRDPVNGEPLRYVRQDDAFLIYSVGVNKIDDGGQHVLVRADGSVVTDLSKEVPGEQRSKMKPGEYDLRKDLPGDWVLWPRDAMEQDRAEK